MNCVEESKKKFNRYVCAIAEACSKFNPKIEINAVHK